MSTNSDYRFNVSGQTIKDPQVKLEVLRLLKPSNNILNAEEEDIQQAIIRLTRVANDLTIFFSDGGRDLASLRIDNDDRSKHVRNLISEEDSLEEKATNYMLSRFPNLRNDSSRLS